MDKPVLISPGMTCHFFDQANYPIYQQYPAQIQTNNMDKCVCEWA